MSLQKRANKAVNVFTNASSVFLTANNNLQRAKANVLAAHDIADKAQSEWEAQERSKG